MPELPEVETIKLQLKRKILNKKIKEVIVEDKRLIKGIPAQKFKSQLQGKAIKDIFRRGKVLIIKLEESLFLIIHLRISGWLTLSQTREKFSRLLLKFADNQVLNFCDQRVLGEARIVRDWRSLPIIKNMGPEPLELKKDEFVKLFDGKRTKVKPLLMDQNFLAGVGNIYAQEILFCAGIHPQRSAEKTKKEELEKIYSCLISILKDAIAKKGSSVDTYRQIDGSQGNYIPFLKVYQREDELCFKCRRPIKRKAIGGRGTYFCSHCQK
ncbi:MAG: bifunctional DNA-formamidopyrimidine glycosylase/DNA-(apurinic or apyrimidinic site) lyase [Candidatus Omnitrophota bacterium]|nr:MAG: bifunctional DNA-formamidopyrimidine glycosylase/DNA-(apurinic or apyrimidinic site) lyase [Candidatus Omnitrophota bacterium]